MDKTPALLRLGAAVRTRRRALGLSQEGLAERADIHMTYVGMVERGERNPTYTNVLRIARGLGCTMSALVEGLDGGEETGEGTQEHSTPAR
ncbi:MAG TPA: helix-turn-helix transcriptional regulator [Rubricoccaceae bacterium]|jgi:transcriptional regulator with XRE-family HTH domain